MISNAILMKLLNLSAWEILRTLCLTVFALGVASSLVVPLFLHLLDNTKKARERQRKAVPAQVQAKINDLSRRLLEAHDRETKLRKENYNMRRLIEAEANWGRNHRADVQATLVHREEV